MGRLIRLCKQRLGLAAPLSAVLLCSCLPPGPEPVAIRLLSQFEHGQLRTPAQLPNAAPPAEWRFDGNTPATPPAVAFHSLFRWQAGPGVADLEIRNGRLAGTTTTEFPIVHLERTSGLDHEDVLQAVEVRLRVSKGTNLGLAFVGSKEVVFEGFWTESVGFPWPMTTPVLPGDDLQTYVLRTGTGNLQPASPSSSIRHVLLRPGDTAGAEFEIESIRLIFRKDYLSSIPSGTSWQGLAGIYRETLVTRSPETSSVSVSLPSRPWLDLAVGTIEDGPVTFRVIARETPPAEQSAGKVVLERTVSIPNQWEGVPVDLSEMAGENVILSFSLEAETTGTLGFWGSPVIRNRGRLPAGLPSPGGRAGEDPDAGTPPRGVILLLADTLRADHLEVYGYTRPTAPELTRLASEGAVFEDCISQASWTKVSVASILTSLYPTSHGISRIMDWLPGSGVTLAEVYRDAGYATLSLLSNPLPGRLSALHQGFEEVHERESLFLPPGQSTSKTARGYVDRLLPWLEAHRDVPFFVFLHVLDPHTPYQTYPPYDKLWGDPAHRAEYNRQLQLVSEYVQDPARRFLGIPTREELEKAGIDAQKFVAYEIDLYDSSIRAMDAEIARLMEGLSSIGLEDDTLIAVISDHGEEFLEHGKLRHGQTLYGEMTNVPLIIWGSGRVPAAVVSETVQSIDLMPTLLELSSLPLPEGIQGQSLVPLLQGGASSSEWRRRPAVSERATPPTGPHLAGVEIDSFAVVADGWKLIHHPRRPGGWPEYELYDHRSDPLDLLDLAASKPEIVEQLARELESWHEQALAARLVAEETTPEGLSSEELQRLRSLGYIQ